MSWKNLTVEELLAWLARRLPRSSLGVWAPGSFHLGAINDGLPACSAAVAPAPPCCLIWLASAARLLCCDGGAGACCFGGRVFSKELLRGASAFLPVRRPLCSSAVKLDCMLASRSGSASCKLPLLVFSDPLGTAAGDNTAGLVSEDVA